MVQRRSAAQVFEPLTPSGHRQRLLVAVAAAAVLAIAFAIAASSSAGAPASGRARDIRGGDRRVGGLDVGPGRSSASPEEACAEGALCIAGASPEACRTPDATPGTGASQNGITGAPPVVDDDRAVPDALFWARVHTFSVTAASLSDRAVAAHRAWGHAIPGLVWIADRPMPALEAEGATVRVVRHSFEAVFDRMTDRMLDIWADVWANQVKPQHQWVVRVWDDNFIWRPGMERQIRAVEQLWCCSPDKPVLVGPMRFFFHKLRGKPFGFAAGGPPWILSRAAMERLSGRSQPLASQAVALHRHWGQQWCAAEWVPRSTCFAAEDVLLSIAAMRVGVFFFEAHGTLPGSVFKTPSRSISDTTNAETLPWQQTVLRCRLPGLTEIRQSGLAADTWAMHYVPSHKQQEVLHAYRAGCDQDTAKALFNHSASGRYAGLSLEPEDFLDIEAEIAAL